jgi:hypothetical protein
MSFGCLMLTIGYLRGFNFHGTRFGTGMSEIHSPSPCCFHALQGESGILFISSDLLDFYRILSMDVCSVSYRATVI